MAIEIEIVEGPDSCKRFVFRRKTVLIGCGGNAHLTLHDRKVSRNHLSITLQRNGAFLVTDNGSKNGTLINAERIKRVIIDSGELVRIGNTVLRIGTPSPSGENSGGFIPLADYLKSNFPVIVKVSFAFVAALALVYLVKTLRCEPCEPPVSPSIEELMSRLKFGDFRAAREALWKIDPDDAKYSDIWYRPGYVRKIMRYVERAEQHERGRRLRVAREEWTQLVWRLENDAESPLKCREFGADWQAAVMWIRTNRIGVVDGIIH